LPPALATALAGRWAPHARDLQEAPAGRVLRLQAPLREESASAVRQRIATGGDWRALLPAAVADYIADHGLYGAAAS
jgi:nicotinate-nucleotide adenylyltransferase